jgi:hypothetical protein
MVFNKYLLNFKFKYGLLNYKYLYYFYILNNVTSNLHIFNKNCKLQNLQFLYIKHIRFISAVKFLPFFFNGPFIVIYSNSILALENIQVNYLKLIAVSINGFFVNNVNLFQLQNLTNFYLLNFFEILNFLVYFFYIFIFNVYYIKYSLSFQIYYLTQKVKNGIIYHIIIMLIIIQGMLVIISKNSVTSILYLIGCYVLTSSLFLILGAEFIAIC